MADMIGKYGDGGAGLGGAVGIAPNYAYKEASTAADHEVVAAVSGKKIRVLGFVLNTAGATTLKFKSAATQIAAGITGVAGTTAVAPTEKDGYFETAAGEALNVNNSAAVAIGVTVVYALI